MARPTSYTPEVIDKINGYLSEAIPQNMKIPTIEGIALKLGVNRDTIYQWVKVNKEFADTIDRVKMLQKEYLIEIGIFGGKDVNPSIVALLLKVNHDMIETERKELVGKDGGELKIKIIQDNKQIKEMSDVGPGSQPSDQELS